MPSVVGNGMALAAIMAAINYTGHSLFQEASDLDADMYPTKEELRKRFRRPVNEVINELGEGRGELGPSFEWPISIRTWIGTDISQGSTELAMRREESSD